jgi:hypothetical protein
MEDNKIGLKTKVCFVDRVSVSYRNITINSLGDDEGSTSFCWHINDRRGKIVKKKCIGEGDMNLIDKQCIMEKEGVVLM